MTSEEEARPPGFEVVPQWPSRLFADAVSVNQFVFTEALPLANGASDHSVVLALGFVGPPSDASEAVGDQLQLMVTPKGVYTLTFDRLAELGRAINLFLDQRRSPLGRPEGGSSD